MTTETPSSTLRHPEVESSPTEDPELEYYELFGLRKALRVCGVGCNSDLGGMLEDLEDDGLVRKGVFLVYRTYRTTERGEAVLEQGRRSNDLKRRYICNGTLDGVSLYLFNIMIAQPDETLRQQVRTQRNVAINAMLNSMPDSPY